MDSVRFKQALESALDRDEVLLLSSFERCLNGPFKYEAKLNLLKLLQKDPEAFDLLTTKFSFARNALNELIFECCRRNLPKLRAGCREYFVLHNESNFNCCFKFGPSPRLLELHEYQNIADNGSY